MNKPSLNDFTAAFGFLEELLEKRQSLGNSYTKNKNDKSIFAKIEALTKEIRTARDNLAKVIAKLPETERLQVLARSRDWLDHRECDNLDWWVKHLVENKPHE